MIRFLKNSLWDMILCWVMIFACATTVFSGFYVPEKEVTDYAVTAGAALVMVLLLTLASYSKRSIVIGIIALVLAFAGMIIFSVGSGQNLFADSEKNTFLRFLLLIIISVAVFVMSRFRAGAVLLFPAGTIALCVTEFMYESRHLVCFLLYLTACCMMIVYRNYMYNVLHSRTLKGAQFSAVAFGLILCLIVTGIGSGIYYGIVKRLNPPARELQLVTKYRALETLDKLGVADVRVVKDPSLKTDNLDDQQDTTKQDTEEKDDDLQDASSQAQEADNTDGNAPNALNKMLKGLFDAIRYDWGIPLWLFWSVLALLIIAGAIGTKILLRKRWFRKVKEKSPDEQVRAMYLFFLKKFRQMKIRPVTGETPAGFAARTAQRLKCFRTEGASPVGFTELTDVLVRTEYGGIKPTFAEITQFESFYRRFYRNCREYLGKVQYIIKFFIL